MVLQPFTDPRAQRATVVSTPVSNQPPLQQPVVVVMQQDPRAVVAGNGQHASARRNRLEPGEPFLFVESLQTKYSTNAPQYSHAISACSFSSRDNFVHT